MAKYVIELKNRIILLFLTWISTLLINYFYKETLLFLVIQPDRLTSAGSTSPMSYFIFTNVTEVFSVYIQLITFLGIQIAFLYFVYHCFVFFSPALFKTEYDFLSLFLGISLFILFFSAIMLNSLIVPLTWDFFSSFQDLVSSKLINLHFEAKLNEYLDFYIMLYYLCVFYCQIFTILFFFLGYVNDKAKVIKKFRKLYYYVFVVFSTLISPPDIFSQIFISLIIIIIYEILVFICLINPKLVRQPVKTN